jgi:hypothetical protein
VWNGASCAVETWTDYCPATVANGGSALHVNQTRQYNNSSPVNYRSKSPAAACCSATNSLSPCIKSGSVSGACTVDIGASSCAGPGPYVSWTSANLTSPQLWVISVNPVGIWGNYSNNITDSGTPPWINGGGVLFELRDGATVIDSEVIGSCAAGSAWDPAQYMCVAFPATGSISATACTIDIGASSCNTSVSWSTANLTAAATSVTYPTNQTLSSLTSSAGISNNINGVSVRSYYLYHAGTLLSQVNVTPSCAVGSTWGGSSCVINPCVNGANNPPTCTTFTACANGANNPPTCNICNAPQILSGGTCIDPTIGNISASACYIIAGESTCNSSVTWSTANAASPNVQLLAANGSDTVISTAVSSPGLGLSSTLSFGTNTFNLKNGSTVLDTDTASATCAPLSTWNGSLCISTQPAKISLLLAQPGQISCPGGSDGITLKLAMSNTVGRVCKIAASPINTTFNAEEKGIQMTAINGQLSTSKYKSSNSEGSNKSLLELMADRNATGFSAGTIVMSSNTKLSSGKRLFNYSTRFKLECDSAAEPLATQYRVTNSTYSSKSVDVLSTCVGQD